MFDIIALVILVIGVIGMVFILYKKVPVLAELNTEGKALVVINLWNKTKDKVKNHKYVKAPHVEIFLHKALSKIRVLILKAENKTGSWLVMLRRKSIEKKQSFKKDDYWKKLKKTN